MIPRIPTDANNYNDGTEHSVRQFTSGKYTVELMPEGYVLLGQEIATGYHPALETILMRIPIAELDERLLAICGYCSVIVDGVYTIQERSILCANLSGRLFHLRDLTKGSRDKGIEGIIALN